MRGQYDIANEGHIDASGKYVFLLPDHLGNVMTATKADGARVQTFSYYPYGGTISATPGTLAFTEEPYRFGGNEIDMFNNYDFHARWYNQMTPVDLGIFQK